MNKFQEAEKIFEDLIAKDCKSIELFREFAHAHLNCAEEKKAMRLFGRAKDHVQKAVELLSR